MAEFPYVPATPSTNPTEPRRARGRLLTLTIVLAAALAMIVGSAPVAGAAVPATHPLVRGYLDIAFGTPGQIHLAGWSYDLKQPGVSNTEDVVVDGVMAALPFANKARPDVNRALHITGKHGYELAVPAKPGVRRLCVISRAVAGSGSAPRVLACKMVTVPRS